MRITGIFFSGTGNTKWVAEKLNQKLLVKNHVSEFLSIEDTTVDVLVEKLRETDLFVVCHPAYGNDMPGILKDYLRQLSKVMTLPNHIKGLSIDVPALYSADGVRASASSFEALGIQHIGGYNIYLSCNFDTFIPGFKIDSPSKNESKKTKALLKMDAIIQAIEEDTCKFDKCTKINTWLGKLEHGSNEKMLDKYQVKVNEDLCIGCGKCVGLCPLENFSMIDKKAKTNSRCTVCLRCINHCPTYAIRFMNEKGTKTFKQYKGPDFI